MQWIFNGSLRVLAAKLKISYLTQWYGYMAKFWSSKGVYPLASPKGLSCPIKN